MLCDKKIIAVLTNRITKPLVGYGHKWGNLKARVQIPPYQINYYTFSDKYTVSFVCRMCSVSHSAFASCGQKVYRTGYR